MISSYNYFSVKNMVMDSAYDLLKRQIHSVILRSLQFIETANEEMKILSYTIDNQKNLSDPSTLSKITKLMGQFRRVSNLVISSGQNNYIFLSKIIHTRLNKDLYLGEPIHSKAAFALGFVKTDANHNIQSRKIHYYSEDLTLITEVEVKEPLLKELLLNFAKIDPLKFKKELTHSMITNNSVVPLVSTLEGEASKESLIYAEVAFNDLSLALDINRFNENSSLYIIENNQKIVTSSSLQEINEKNNVSMMGDKNMRLLHAGFNMSLKDKDPERKDKVLILPYEGIDYIVVNEPFPSTFPHNWRAVSLSVASDFTKISDIITDSSSILFSIVILLTVIFWLYFQINKYSHPIVNLAIEANKIHLFDLEDSVNVKSSTKEIANLATEIQNMKVNVKNFARFIPKGLVQKFVSTGEDVEIGGKEINVTILFTDIANFTTISESYEPAKLVIQLSEYLEELTSVILKNKGTIDKYIGYAIMSFWGAPDIDHDQTENACTSALLCVDKLIGLNKYWSNTGQCEFLTRFGIHEGKAIVGNIGSSERMNYTAIGDNVNLAARLEGSNKYYGTSILISETIHKKLSEKFIRRPADIVAFKGKVEGIRIYHLIGLDDHGYLKPISQKHRQYLAEYNRAYELYQVMEWERANHLFETLRNITIEQKIEDKLVEIYCKRTQDFMKNPPPQDWNGIIHLTEK